MFMALITGIASQTQVYPEECFTPTAAFNYKNVYLVQKTKFIKLDNNLEEIETGDLRNKFNYPENDLDAAFVDYSDNTLYFILGNQYSYLTPLKATSPMYPLTEWGRFYANGVDAMDVLGRQNYAFKGCEYWSTWMWTKQKTSSLELPCNLDAAFDYDDNLYVTKGAEVYILYMDDYQDIYTSSARNLSSVVTLKSTTFCDE